MDLNGVIISCKIMKPNKINHISVIISTRNAEEYIDKCFQSVLNQDYPDFEVIFVDAESSDKTFEIAKSYESKYSNLKCIRNEIRKYQVENFILTVGLSKPKSIIVSVDADDYLKHDMVLHRVNSEYNKYDCWISFGTYEHCNPYGDVSKHYHAFPNDVIKNKSFRNYKWISSHLRSWRKELFEKIKMEDLIDPITGKFFSFVGDLAIMFPMLEMASLYENKIRYIPDILYCYNVGNPTNESKVNQQEIDRIEKHIRSLPPYQTLEKLYEDE